MHTLAALQHLPHRLWEAVYDGVDRLTVNQTAAIGGTGSLASTATTLSADQVMSGLQFLTMGMGALGALLSVGLMALKWVQQRREMRAWGEKNNNS
jgi:hypothetical protein